MLWRRELSNLLRLALPISAAQALTQGMNVVDILFVGHLGTSELATATLGASFFQIIQHPNFGMFTALDTLLAQAYGAKQMGVYREWVKVGLLVGGMACIPWCIALALSGSILHALRIEANLATQAGRYCSALIYGVPPYVAFNVLTKVLQAQGIVTPSVYIALISNIANALADWLLIYKGGLGIDGAPLATSLSRWIQLLLICAYMAHRRTDLSASLPGYGSFRRLATRAQLASFFRIGLPGAMMLGLEAWFFEAATVMASYLGDVSLDAHSIMLTICAFTFLSLPFAFGIAASIRTGHLLGAGDGPSAQLAAKVCLVVVLAIMSTLMAVKVALRWQLGWLFSNDAVVVMKVASIAPIAALFQLSDGLQGAAAGVMRGMGKQSLVAALNFVGFWLIGASVGPALAFGAHVGVAGLWWGMAAGLTFTACLMLTLLFRTDWTAEASAARARVLDAAAGKGDASTVAPATTMTSIESTTTTDKVVATHEIELPVAAHAAEGAGGIEGWSELNPAAQQAQADAAGGGRLETC